MPLQLSVLDFDFTFGRTVELVPLVETLGYARYWFGEHPPQPNVEMLVALAAGLSTRLRIGTGGVVLRLRNVLQCATNFLFLTQAFGERIDAGVCAGWTHSEHVARALGGVDVEEYPARVGLLRDFLTGTDPDNLLATVRPFLAKSPQLWNLGTGPSSARLAARLGLSYAYSLFNTHSVDDRSAMDIYRSEFVSVNDMKPRTMLAIAGLCADTDARARELVSIETPRVLALNTTVTGGIETCRRQLLNLSRRYEMDELLILDQSPTIADAVRSLTFFAEIAGGL